MLGSCHPWGIQPVSVIAVVVVDAVVLGGGAGLLYREGNFFKGLRVSDNSSEGLSAGAKPPEDLSSIRSHFGSLVTCYISANWKVLNSTSSLALVMVTGTKIRLVAVNPCECEASPDVLDLLLPYMILFESVFKSLPRAFVNECSISLVKFCLPLRYFFSVIVVFS